MLICSDEFKPSMFKKHSCYFDVKKHECVDMEFSRIDDFMAMLERAGPKARQKVLLTFADDYENDSRELLFIPEVVEFVKGYAERYPYFWYFVMPERSIYLPHVFLAAKAAALDNATERYALNVSVENIKNFARVLAYNLQIYGESIGDIEGGAESFKVWLEAITQGMTEEPPSGIIAKL